MAVITHPAEVSLFGNIYPIVGAIKQSLASQFPTKIVVGDFTKDSGLYTSSLVLSDHYGGIGVMDMDEKKDFNRSLWSTCDLNTVGKLLLPPLITSTTAPTGASANGPYVLVQLGTKLYGVWLHTDAAYKVWLWTNAGASWGSSIKTLNGISHAVAHKDYLFFTSGAGDDIARFDGTATWTTTSANNPSFFVEWDSKLLCITDFGVLMYTVDAGANWVTHFTDASKGIPGALFLAPNTDGYTVPHMLTKMGVYALDWGNAKWVETPLLFPQGGGPAASFNNAAALWRDDAYIPVGLTLYQYRVQGSVVGLTPMGPGDRDYGLDADYRGTIKTIIPEQNDLYALIDRGSLTAYPTILKWNGVGWSVVYVASATNVNLLSACVSTADSTYRFWFGAEGVAKYIDLNKEIRNPLEISTYTYGVSCTHDWPWFDADVAANSKTGVKVTANVSYVGDAGNVNIMLYYRITPEASWTLLTSTTYADGKIDGSLGAGVFTQSETAEFGFASSAGVEFKRIQFRAVLVRNTTTTETPRLNWLRLDYLKNIDSQWGFDVKIDGTRDYRHKRCKTLVAALKTAAETKTLGSFTFRTIDGVDETYNVRIVSMEGVTKAGIVKEGQYQVKLLAL